MIRLLFWMALLSLRAACGGPPTQTTSEYSQDSSFLLIHKIPMKAEQLFSDKLQQIYVIDQNSIVHKLDSSGKQLFSYRKSSFGFPASIDASNPFRLMLFYPDIPTNVILDRTMNPIVIPDYSKLNLFRISASCIAADGNTWLYDPDRFRLLKVGNSAEILFESPDLSLLLGALEEPVFMRKYENHIFLSIPESGLIVFDIFGNYVKTLELSGIRKFQLIGEEIWYSDGKHFHAVHLKSLERKKTELPTICTEALILSKNNLCLLKNGDLLFYKKIK